MTSHRPPVGREAGRSGRAMVWSAVTLPRVGRCPTSTPEFGGSRSRSEASTGNRRPAWVEQSRNRYRIGRDTRVGRGLFEEIFWRQRPHRFGRHDSAGMASWICSRWVSVLSFARGNLSGQSSAGGQHAIMHAPGGDRRGGQPSCQRNGSETVLAPDAMGRILTDS